MQIIWKLKQYDKLAVNEICEKYKFSNKFSKLLLSRNISLDEIPNFLNNNLDNLKDPFEIKDMERFVQRIDLAIKNNEKIVIYGDYDTDGVTSVVILYDFLKKLGLNVGYYLPDRQNEGYGLNLDAISTFKKNEVSLIITVDCGISAVDEVKYAKSLGIDVCITDHHECEEILPNASCVINPKRKDDNSNLDMLAGVGVVFKCISALSIYYNLPKKSYLDYLDLVALGTISDIVPLTGENRIIAKEGIEYIKNTRNIGLKALISLTGITNIDTNMISYMIAPKINACGRMSNALKAVELFLTNDMYQAKKLSILLDKLNKERQLVENRIFDEITNLIQNNKLENENSIILWSPNWHNGVLGIVASRLVNIYSKPIILFTYENDKVARGSARSPKGISIYKLISECKNILLRFGGHDLATGLTVNISNLELFKLEIQNLINENIEDTKIIEIDEEISGNDLNYELYNYLEMLKPYGHCNKEPLFLYRNLKIKSIRNVKNGKHLKLELVDKDKTIYAIAFLQGFKRDMLKISDKIDVVCTIVLNENNKLNKDKNENLILIEDFKKV